jgi:ABC-type glycerol-3-phosphate transport system substrate-binding protein
VEGTLIPSSSEEIVITPQPAGSFIRIWLPPEFDPDGNSSANKMLKSRLAEFETQNPEVRLEVRVKALDGAGGLLEALVAANVAAPLALPDLILLPRPLLESAALKGLLYPYDGLTSLVDEPIWFEYAQQLAHLKTGAYGMPFAGDAMILAYHPSMMDASPDNMEAILSLGEELLFPAADPQALFTLCMIQARGESLQDDEGRPALDETTLVSILEFDQRASLAGVMPYWLTQYSNDEQVWEAFRGEQYSMAILWASVYLRHRLNDPADLALVPLPLPDSDPFTLATGWSWALAGRDPQRRSLSVRLAEFLVEKEFLAKWSYAAGYLPPRVDALGNWGDAQLRQVVERISSSAHQLPPADLISSLGPALEQAVVDVLKAQSEPRIAARAVISQINQP